MRTRAASFFAKKRDTLLFLQIGNALTFKNDTFCVCFCVTQRDDARGDVMASDLPVAVRIHQYLRTLSTHLRERAAAMLLAEARDEIERLRLTDEERQAIDRQADWLARKAQEAGDIHSADLRLQEAATLRGLLERTQ
jgi:hypothetical protein